MKTRQYAQKSIFDLETIFEQSRNNVSELEQLLSELTFRNTARARTLTLKIEQSLTALSDRSEVAMSASSPSTCNPGSASIKFSQAVPHNAPAAVEQLQPKAIPDTAKRQQGDKDQIDIGRLPSFSPSGKTNDARAILAAWTAFEALSPQGYKRPEEMVTGDRSSVFYWSEAFHGDQTLAASPITSSISRSSSAQLLGQGYGRVGQGVRRGRGAFTPGWQESGRRLDPDRQGRQCAGGQRHAVSSFAWALKLALDMKLGSLGDWPNVEQRIIEHWIE